MIKIEALTRAVGHTTKTRIYHAEKLHRTSKKKSFNSRFVEIKSDANFRHFVLAPTMMITILSENATLFTPLLRRRR